MFESSLNIRGLTISPPLALAPMVGLSHTALRTLILEIGGVGVLFSEMLSATRLPRENQNVSPCLIRSTFEKPLFYQIFLNNADAIPSAINKLHTLDPQGIDLNVGCPAPVLRKQGAGSALSRTPDILKKIISTMRANSDLPISVKIRLGDGDDKQGFIEFCRIIEGEGADCLSIHARFNGEKFCRKPRWEWIALAKNELSIPIIANGGIFSVEDAKTCLERSGADGLMIGRGGACYPWLFADIAEEVYGIPKNTPFSSARDIYLRFFDLLNERFEENRRLGRLKQFTHYFALQFLYGHRFASNIQNSKTMESAREIAENFFANSEAIAI